MRRSIRAAGTVIPYMDILKRGYYRAVGTVSPYSELIIYIPCPTVVGEGLRTSRSIHGRVMEYMN